MSAEQIIFEKSDLNQDRLDSMARLFGAAMNLIALEDIRNNQEIVELLPASLRQRREAKIQAVKDSIQKPDLISNQWDIIYRTQLMESLVTHPDINKGKILKAYTNRCTFEHGTTYHRYNIPKMIVDPNGKSAQVSDLSGDFQQFHGESSENFDFVLHLDLDCLTDPRNVTGSGEQAIIGQLRKLLDYPSRTWEQIFYSVYDSSHANTGKNPYITSFVPLTLINQLHQPICDLQRQNANSLGGATGSLTMTYPNGMVGALFGDYQVGAACRNKDGSITTWSSPENTTNSYYDTPVISASNEALDSQKLEDTEVMTASLQELQSMHRHGVTNREKYNIPGRVGIFGMDGDFESCITPFMLERPKDSLNFTTFRWSDGWSALALSVGMQPIDLCLLMDWVMQAESRNPNRNKENFDILSKYILNTILSYTITLANLNKLPDSIEKRGKRDEHGNLIELKLDDASFSVTNYGPVTFPRLISAEFTKISKLMEGNPYLLEVANERLERASKKRHKPASRRI